MSIFQQLKDKFLALVLGPLVTCLGCAGAPKACSRPMPTAQEQYNRTVLITAYCVGGSQLGTGVITQTGEVYTANHVVSCDVGQPILIMAGDSLASVLRSFEGEDIAVLSAQLGTYLPLEIGPIPEVGDTVCHTNSAPRPSRNCGEVWPSDDGTIKNGALADHGNSGSPLWDRYGRLIGITTHLVTCTNGQICGGKASPLVGK
jgi:S1-C subfamily serine protease